MKTILVFGDSNTWGSCPHTANRHDRKHRWPSAMAEGLDNVEVITEGLRGRTTAFPRPTASADMSGVNILPALLHSHAPIDLVMIMLGTNDIYEGYATPHIRDGLARLIEIIRHHPWRQPEAATPEIMLISPPPVTVGDNSDVTIVKQEQSEQIAETISALAADSECQFFDAGQITRASPVDGFHLEPEDSRALGVALQEPVKKLLAKS